MLTLTFLYYGTGLNLRPQYLTQGAHLFSLLSSENTPPPLPRVPVLSLLCHFRRVGLLVSFQYSGWQVLEERGVKKNPEWRHRNNPKNDLKLASASYQVNCFFWSGWSAGVVNAVSATRREVPQKRHFKNTEVPPRGAISCPGLPAEFSLAASIQQVCVGERGDVGTHCHTVNPVLGTLLTLLCNAQRGCCFSWVAALVIVLWPHLPHFFYPEEVCTVTG